MHTSKGQTKVGVGLNKNKKMKQWKKLKGSKPRR
jgi:hypothetical protein